MNLHIAVVLKDRRFAAQLVEEFSNENAWVENIPINSRTWEQVIRHGSDMIIIDEQLIPEPIDRSMALLNELPEEPTSVVITDSDSSEEHARLLEANCDTVLYSGLETGLLIGAIDSAIQARSQLNRYDFTQHQQVGAGRPMLSDFYSKSPEMQMFMQTVQRIVQSNASLLILGETGVGKEHLARAIHNEGPRSTSPFIAVNIAALPEQLLESELFGHEAGAFTGASRGRRGAFEMAHTGTLFLDEIGEMPLHLQAKMLRVLQDFQVRRIGSEKTIQVNVRVIAATNRDLEEELQANRFRQDLYYRIGVISLTIPPLRKHSEDIPELAEKFLARLKFSLNTSAKYLQREVIQRLAQYDWPGNIRELKNVLERAMLLCDGKYITLSDLPTSISLLDPSERLDLIISEQIPEEWKNMTLPEVRTKLVDQVEKAYIIMALEMTGGKVGKAAAKAGIHIRGFYEKMKKYQIDKSSYKP